MNATLQTNHGTIEVELYPDDAPLRQKIESIATTFWPVATLRCWPR